MPHVNGKFYHHTSQGYAAEKAKAIGGQSEHGEAHREPTDEGEGPIVHVKHLGGGKFHTKSQHHDGHVTHEKHETPEEMHAHLDKHFGMESEPSEGGDDTEDYEADTGEGLKSILG